MQNIAIMTDTQLLAEACELRSELLTLKASGVPTFDHSRALDRVNREIRLRKNRQAVTAVS